MLVKICRIKDIATVRLCGKLGADMIGIHCIEKYTLEDALFHKEILYECQTYFPCMKPVLVTKIIDISVLADIAATGFKTFQIHTEVGMNWIFDLRKEISRVCNVNITIILTLSLSDDNIYKKINEFDSIIDYFLIDTNYIGGTGKTGDKLKIISILQAINHVPVFLAGGLNASNVLNVVEGLKISGVDVQSGVETESLRRPKSPQKLIDFISKFKDINLKNLIELSPESNRTFVSLALTRFEEPILSLVDKYKRTNVDFVHLDFSDGSIAPKFVVYPIDTLKSVTSNWPCIPYEIHLFIDQREKKKSIIEECLEINPYLRVVYLHCKNWNDFDMPEFSHMHQYLNNKKIGTAFTFQATGFNAQSIKTVLNAIRSFDIYGISIITRSQNHCLDDIKGKDLDLLKIVSRWKGNRLIDVSIDRDINVEKLTILAEGHPNHAIVGKTLVNSLYPSGELDNIRNLLTSTK